MPGHCCGCFDAAVPNTGCLKLPGHFPAAGCSSAPFFCETVTASGLQGALGALELGLATFCFGPAEVEAQIWSGAGLTKLGFRWRLICLSSELVLEWSYPILEMQVIAGPFWVLSARVAAGRSQGCVGKKLRVWKSTYYLGIERCYH